MGVKTSGLQAVNVSARQRLSDTRRWGVRRKARRRGMRSAGGLAWLIVLIWLLALVGAQADGVTPTTEWINLYGMESTWNGEPLPVGATVAVFRPDGVKCGEMVVTVEGWYGLLPCYGEAAEPLRVKTRSLSETDAQSANGGLTFTVNGFPAGATPVSLNGVPVPPSTTVTWTATGDLWQVNLRGASRTQAVGGHTVAGWRLRTPVWCLRILLPLGFISGAGAVCLMTLIIKRGSPFKSR